MGERPPITGPDDERAGGPASGHLERVAVDVSRMAAALVRQHVGTASAAGTKSTPSDVVTATDVESEAMIRRELAARCPGSTVIGEEMGDDVGSNSIGWIVDPIDGTVNFLYDLPVVAVSIAATIDGEVVAGAVSDVLRGETFSASTETVTGARRDGVPIDVSATGTLDASLVGTGFAYAAESRRRQAAVMSRLLPRCRDVRCMGSAALNLCWVASGRLDAYFEQHTKVYDYAAGAFIARTAGATVELPEQNSSDLVVAATPAVFSDLRSTIAVD